jgi:hypothetical protein
MRISKPLLYCNVTALLVNGVIVWLMAVRVFPLMLGITIFFGCMAGAVWFSCKVNGKLPNQGRPATFYSGPTEEMEGL